MSNVPSITGPNCVRYANSSIVELFAEAVFGDPTPQHFIESIEFRLSKNSLPYDTHIIDSINQEVPPVISHQFSTPVENGDVLAWQIVVRNYEGSSSSGIGVNIYDNFTSTDSQLFVAHIGAFGIIHTEDIEDTDAIITTEDIEDLNEETISTEPIDETGAIPTDNVGSSEDTIYTGPLDDVIDTEPIDGGGIISTEDITESETIIITEDVDTIAVATELLTSVGVIDTEDIVDSESIIITEDLIQAKAIKVETI